VDERTRALVELSSAIARGARGEWRERIVAAQAVATAEEIEETILQSYLFLGFPTALQALGVWRDLASEVASVESNGQLSDWQERGERICAIVYGGQYNRLRENITKLHPDVESWMLTEGYGKVLARPGLDLKTRELCIIALLASQDAPHQLHSHLRGALNAGATTAEVDAAVGSVLRSLAPAHADVARQLWNEVRSRKTQEKES
jgi:4-carboxymuconolactone decarboxylase